MSWAKRQLERPVRDPVREMDAAWKRVVAEIQADLLCPAVCPHEIATPPPNGTARIDAQDPPAHIPQVTARHDKRAAAQTRNEKIHE